MASTEGIIRKQKVEAKRSFVNIMISSMAAEAVAAEALPLPPAAADATEMSSTCPPPPPPPPPPHVEISPPPPSPLRADMSPQPPSPPATATGDSKISPPPAAAAAGDSEISPPPAAVPKHAEMGQMVCGNCRELLSYPRGATYVQCACCQIINFVLEEHQVGNVKCGRCFVLLMYPYGAAAVRCSSCNFVTEIGEHNIRPPLSVQQGRHPSSVAYAA